jgi:hypothetical protein
MDGFMLIFLSFFLPQRLIPASSRSEREEEAAGRSVLRPIQICLATPSLKKISLARQANSPQPQTADSSARNATSFSSARTMESVDRRCDARQQRKLLVRWNPREPTKLQSQQFIATLRPRERYRCTDSELTWCAGGMFWGRLRTKLPSMTITSSRNGGVGLTGNRGRKTADSSDVSASEINRNTAAHFMFLAGSRTNQALASKL